MASSSPRTSLRYRLTKVSKISRLQGGLVLMWDHVPNCTREADDVARDEGEVVDV
jgi:hypothetical protein